VNALGHSDAGIAAVLAAQATKVQHVSNILHTWEPLHLARDLVKHSKHFDKVFLCNSGTEANEGALKFARKVALMHAAQAAAGIAPGSATKPPPHPGFGCKATPPTMCFTQNGTCGCWPQAANNNIARALKPEVLAFKNSFHGRTMGALAATHKPAIRMPFAPFGGDVKFARFNNLDGASARRAGGGGWGGAVVVGDGARPGAERRALTTDQPAGLSPPPLTFAHTPPRRSSPRADVHKLWGPKIGAVIVEPVQGEGGIFPADPAFLRGVKDLCAASGALLIVDEVQCGLGRTGRLFAHEAYDVAPDMMTLAKPLAGGLPIGAILMSDAVAACIEPGDHGTTYGGNPLIAAVGRHVLGRIAAPEFLASVRARGAQLAAGARALAAKYPHAIREVRTTADGGLFVGIDMILPFKPVQTAAAARGLLVISAGENTIRLAPPLVITEAEVARGLAALDAAFAEAHPAKAA
jgi:acetylornithine aminotransferase